MDDDQSVIAQVRAGATNAFRILVDRHQAVVWVFCRNLLRHADDADDATQDVFLLAYRKLDQYDSARGSFATWLLTMARSQCCNRLSQHRPMEAVPESVWDAGPSPTSATSDEDWWRRLDGALAMLPLEQRTAFVLAEIQERPHHEIAAIEGVELGTVKSRVSRAKARLRAALSDWVEATATGGKLHP
jgi:RNA polymerase sigma-70 factor (ECF subfamily)